MVALDLLLLLRWTFFQECITISAQQYLFESVRSKKYFSFTQKVSCSALCSRLYIYNKGWLKKAETGVAKYNFILLNQLIGTCFQTNLATYNIKKFLNYYSLGNTQSAKITHIVQNFLVRSFFKKILLIRFFLFCGVGNMLSFLQQQPIFQKAIKLLL